MTDTFQATGKVGMGLQRGELVIIEPGTAQAFVVQFEAQRLDQMQGAARIGAQPDDIAGIRRNFWLKKDDVKHARLRAEEWRAFYP